MKTRLLVLSCIAVGMALAEEPASVVGPIADGSPQLTVPPPILDIRPDDVISSKVADLGDRKITLHQITPLELPSAPEPESQPEITDEARAAFRAMNRSAPERVLLMMSVTVYRSETYSGKVRTLFRWWSQDRSREFEAWSNVDGCWLSGFCEFRLGGKQYSLLLGIGELDVDKCAAAMASKGREYVPPRVPELPQDGPAFVVTGGNPTPEELAPIQAIHELVRNESEKLRLAYEGRKQAQKAHEEYQKANPLKPQDIVLNFWRIPKAAADNTQNGGAR